MLLIGALGILLWYVTCMVVAFTEQQHSCGCHILCHFRCFQYNYQDGFILRLYGQVNDFMSVLLSVQYAIMIGNEAKIPEQQAMPVLEDAMGEDEDDLFGPDPTSPPTMTTIFGDAGQCENACAELEDLFTADTEADAASHSSHHTVQERFSAHTEATQSPFKESTEVSGLSSEPKTVASSSKLPSIESLKNPTCSQQPPSPPHSDPDTHHSRLNVPLGIQNRLPSPPTLTGNSVDSLQPGTSRQGSPADYEGPSLDSDQLPIEQLDHLQVEARAKKLFDNYKSNGEFCKDPNLQSSLEYLSQLNPESQILWLGQQPTPVKQRAMHAINYFKKDAEIRRAPNLESDLKHLATLDPARQLAYLRWPGAQPVAAKALTGFEKEIRRKGWPLDRFKELYLMSSEEQVNYLYERMEFWPGFAKQHGLAPRPSNSDPKWEGRWPDSPQLEFASRTRSPTPIRDPSISLLNKSNGRSTSAYLVPPDQSPLLRPPSPKKDLVNLPAASSAQPIPLPTSRISTTAIVDDDNPPMPGHLFTSSASALASSNTPSLRGNEFGQELLQNRAKTPLPSQEPKEEVRKSVEPMTPMHPSGRESSPPYEDRSAAPSPSGSQDVATPDSLPVPPLNPARMRPSQPEEQQTVSSSPDIIATSTPTVPSPRRTMTVAHVAGNGQQPFKPRSRSRSRSRSPKKLQDSPRKRNFTRGDIAPIVPKRSYRRKSLGVAGAKVGKIRKATQGNTNPVRDAVEKIEMGLKIEKAKATTHLQQERDITPRRSQRIRQRRDRHSMSPSPTA